MRESVIMKGMRILKRKNQTDNFNLLPKKKKADTKSNNTSTSPAKPVKEDERATEEKKEEEEIARSKKTIDALRTIDVSSVPLYPFVGWLVAGWQVIRIYA